MKALCFDRFGGPDVLEVRELPDPELRAGHALVRTRAIGLNFADVYRRKGNYHLEGTPPFILGYEAAGEVVAVNAPVAASAFRPGARVGFADCPRANAELVAVPVEKLIPLSEDVSFETAAASLLQGLTAQYLVRDSHRVVSGESILIHAAAGGVGSLLVQLCSHLGGRVLGLTSSETKRAHVQGLGTSATLLYSEPWVERARQFSKDGRGVDVVYDSVGSTLLDSLAAARTGGQVVFFGMAGGDPAPVDPRLLMDTSKTLTGGDLWNVLPSQDERLRRAGELFGWIRRGDLKVHVSERFGLADGAAAHRALESRKSVGKVLLIP